MWGWRRSFAQGQWEELNDQVILLTREQKLPEAAELAARTAASCRKAFGKWNANTMKTLNNLGMIEILLARFDAAESHLLAALEICERVWGKDNQEAAVISSNLARLFDARAGGATRAERTDGTFAN